MSTAAALLLAVFIVGLILLCAGFLIALDDDQDRYRGRSMFCVFGGLILIVGCVLRFGYVVLHALQRMS